MDDNDVYDDMDENEYDNIQHEDDKREQDDVYDELEDQHQNHEEDDELYDDLEEENEKRIPVPKTAPKRRKDRVSGINISILRSSKRRIGTNTNKI